METLEKTNSVITEKAGEKAKKKKTIIIIGVVFLLLIIGAVMLFLLPRGGAFSSAPAVTVETPAKMSETDREPFSLKLELSSLGDEAYPAASFSLSFDPSKLEFMGIDEGNVIIRSEESSFGTASPKWSVNVEKANETGLINIMYLDMTGGKYAFSKDYLKKEDNVLFLLNFRLRGGVRQGDILEISFEDAVFAASDEAKSLASSADTLKTNNGRIVIGK